MTTQLNEKLISNLVCPLTGAALSVNKKKTELISKSARIAFPIRDGIPIMLASEARTLTTAEINKLK
ncbi:MAG: Trm112 family protein [Nitratireductor sp.]